MPLLFKYLGVTVNQGLRPLGSHGAYQAHGQISHFSYQQYILSIKDNSRLEGFKKRL